MTVLISHRTSRLPLLAAGLVLAAACSTSGQHLAGLESTTPPGLATTPPGLATTPPGLASTPAGAPTTTGPSHRSASTPKPAVTRQVVAYPSTVATTPPTVAPVATHPASPKPSPTHTANPCPTSVGSELLIKTTEYSFAPNHPSVKKCQPIRITNAGAAPHTWTGSPGPFDSGNLDPGGSFTYHFTTTGTFSFVCSYHSGAPYYMTGSITVT